ncbi:hypothetical protein GX865_00190 [Candidatus Saccharibacteria bacterium]|jgi:hypothetical protein|nr:hypothetical protein [Candidatus Saccharibacteria bacterium]
MKSELLDTLAIEQASKDRFGIDLEVRQMIALEIPISHTGTASIFLTKKKQLYTYIHAQSPLVLGDVQKAVSRLGLKAELYIPPKGQPQYFDTIGREKFHKVYPGRGNVTAADIRFYKTLAPYNPALVLISEVKNGIIYQFDIDAKSHWRPSKRFAYRRIATS